MNMKIIHKKKLKIPFNNKMKSKSFKRLNLNIRRKLIAFKVIT